MDQGGAVKWLPKQSPRDGTEVEGKGLELSLEAQIAGSGSLLDIEGQKGEGREERRKRSEKKGQGEGGWRPAFRGARTELIPDPGPHAPLLYLVAFTFLEFAG